MFSMCSIWDELGCSSVEQKLLACELVYAIAVEPSNGVGVFDRDELRRVIFGDMYGSLMEQIVGVAGYCANDIENLLRNSLDWNDGNLFGYLGGKLHGQKIIPGWTFWVSGLVGRSCSDGNPA